MRIQGPASLGALVLGVVLCSGCPSVGAPGYRVHPSLLDLERGLPKKILVVPGLVYAAEVSAGGLIEEVPSWSREAAPKLREVLDGYLARTQGVQTVSIPELSTDEQALVQEHLYMFRVAADVHLPSPLGATTSKDLEAWWHKVERFDLSLGPGLAFLADRTGCETALLSAGITIVPTSGRKFTSFLQSFLAGTTIPTGGTDLFVGLVDLRSGDLLWVNEHAQSGDFLFSADSLLERKDLEKIVERVFADYPGIEEYRAALEKRE